jgi:hypothetical protein
MFTNSKGQKEEEVIKKETPVAFQSLIFYEMLGGKTYLFFGRIVLGPSTAGGGNLIMPGPNFVKLRSMLLLKCRKLIFMDKEIPINGISLDGTGFNRITNRGFRNLKMFRKLSDT